MLSDNDVICGRIPREIFVDQHPGNVRFNQLINEYKGAYNDEKCSRLEKTRIIQAIISRLGSGAKFKKKIEKDRCWQELEIRSVYEKISSVLRGSSKKLKTDSRTKKREGKIRKREQLTPGDRSGDRTSSAFEPSYHQDFSTSGVNRHDLHLQSLITGMDNMTPDIRQGIAETESLDSPQSLSFSGHPAPDQSPPYYYSCSLPNRPHSQSYPQFDTRHVILEAVKTDSPRSYNNPVCNLPQPYDQSHLYNNHACSLPHGQQQLSDSSKTYDRVLPANFSYSSEASSVRKIGAADESKFPMNNTSYVMNSKQISGNSTKIEKSHSKNNLLPRDSQIVQNKIMDEKAIAMPIVEPSSLNRKKSNESEDYEFTEYLLECFDVDLDKDQFFKGKNCSQY